jgi:NAD(P)-dependent dehydrogenase (short-subunit alcohol dehydrogenase family)
VGGTYLVTRAVLPGMLDRDYGRIVNISSGAADRASAGWSAYCAAKAAVDQLTRVLALELDGSGIAVSAFDPGLVDPAQHSRVRPPTPQPNGPARVVAYLCLAETKRNGSVVEIGDTEIVAAAEAALR